MVARSRKKWPLIEILPSLIRSSQARRDPKPAAARKRFRRIAARCTMGDSQKLVAGESFFGLCLGQSNHTLALFELAALFHQLDPLKALQNAALGFDGALALQARMLAHRGAKSGPNPRKSNPNRSTRLLCGARLVSTAPLQLQPFRKPFLTFG